MTVLPFLNVFIGLFTYPFVIRVLGTTAYGTYVVMLSIFMIVTAFISFSFNLLATKEVAENINNLHKKSQIVSSVFFARIFLASIISIFVLLLPLFIPFLYSHFLLYIVCFLATLSQIFLHPWYFQAIENMKIVTYIQLFFTLLSLPFIFFLLHSESDIVLYASIMTSTTIFWAFFSFVYLLKIEKIYIIWTGFSSIKHRIQVSLPFFYTTIIGIIKEQSIPQILGIYFGMHQVALYDLAKKIMSIPLMLTMNINNAFFPKFAKNPNMNTIKKIIKYEYIFWFICILIIALLGKWAVHLLGWDMMKESYYILLILSINILTYLVVWAYIYFVFVLQNRNELLLKNQILAFVSFFLFIFIGFYFYNSIYVLIFALVFSWIAEIVFCHWNFKKIITKK